jgi:hypothetical protein
MTDSIAGISALNGVPTQARVVLINSVTNLIVASQLSDPGTGAWSFTGLATGTYEVVQLIDGYKGRVDGPWSAVSVSDPYFANVSCLLHLDGAHGSTVIVDVKGRTWTVFGAAALTTVTKKAGTASLHPNGGYIQSESHADFGFGSGDYTVEGWNRWGAAGGFSCILDSRSGSNQGIAVYDRNSSGASFITVYNNAAQMGATTFGVPGTAEFYHWFVGRQGTTLYAGANGLSEAIGTDSRTYASAASITLGANYIGTQGQSGQQDEFRATKGQFRYGAGGYTIPSAPFPDS